MWCDMGGDFGASPGGNVSECSYSLWRDQELDQERFCASYEVG